MDHRPCSLIAPDCPYSEDELLSATIDLGITEDNTAIRRRFKRQAAYDRNYPVQSDHYSGFYRQQDQSQRYVDLQRRRRQHFSPHRRQSSGFGGMPPIFRPRDAMSREVCRTCDVRGNVCSVYGIGQFIQFKTCLLIQFLKEPLLDALEFSWLVEFLLR